MSDYFEAKMGKTWRLPTAGVLALACCLTTAGDFARVALARPADSEAEGADPSDEMPEENARPKKPAAKAKTSKAKPSASDKSKAKTTAKKPLTPSLRYALKEGERYVYEVEIQLDLGDSTQTITGLSRYTVKRADDDEMVLEHSGRLVGRNASRSGSPRFNPRHRHAMGSVPQSYGGSGELTIGATGEVIKNSSKDQLPFLLGPLATLIFEPLSPDNQAKWEVSNNVALAGKSGGKNSSGPASRARGRTMRASGQQEKPAFVSAAVEQANYSRTPGKNNTVKIKKHLELKSQAATAEIPAMEKTSDGEITFDLKAGVPTKATIKEVLHVATASAPLTVTYRRLSDAEVDKLDEQAATEKADREAKEAERNRPLDDEDVRKLLAELRQPDKRRAAADRLAKGPANTMRDDVAKALGKLLNDPEDSTRSCAAKALAVWGTGDNVPALVKLLDDRNVFLKSDAIKTLGAIGDQRGAEAVAKQLPLERHHASDALKKLGPPAEPYVVPFLEDRDEGVRTEACKILADIGTEKSRAGLESLAKSGRGFDAREAEKALKQIEARQ